MNLIKTLAPLAVVDTAIPTDMAHGTLPAAARPARAASISKKKRQLDADEQLQHDPAENIPAENNLPEDNNALLLAQTDADLINPDAIPPDAMPAEATDSALESDPVAGASSSTDDVGAAVVEAEGSAGSGSGMGGLFAGDNTVLTSALAGVAVLGLAAAGGGGGGSTPAGGTPPPPADTAPTLLPITQANLAAGVETVSKIVLTFSENVQAGAGNIVIVNQIDAGDTRNIAISGGNNGNTAIINGNTVTISLDPANALTLGQNYNVTITSGVITDLAGNAFAGVAGATVSFAVSAINLGTLNGSNGYVFAGGAASDFSGRAVSNVGDVNGDGFDDFIIGAFGADSPGDRAGASYVVFGGAGVGTGINLGSLAATDGFKISGGAAFDLSGHSVSGAGDVNGDGLADFIVGAYGVNGSASVQNSGASYVVFGKTTGLVSFNLNSLIAANGFKLSGASATDYSGFSVSSAGDINGDGYADLVIGAYGAAGVNAAVDAGAAYVVFGQASVGANNNFSLASLNEPNSLKGFKLIGVAASDNAGVSVSNAGDINGDGFADLIVGANLAGTNDAGAAYVLLGKAGGFDSIIALDSLVGANGFQISGVTAGDFAGISVSSAGDVNGDGLDDLIVGATGANAAAGAAYVVFGKTSFAGAVSLATLDDSDGFKLSGVAAGDASGVSVSSAGDVNGDGYADLIVGANAADPNGADSGATYIVLGKATGFGTSGNFNLSTINGTNGFRLTGAAAGDLSGVAVSSAGDINGDGFDDLIVGASSADPNGADSGASYVIFGSNFTGATILTGSATTTNVAEIFVGGFGDNTLTGGGGADAFQGGAGNDTIIVGDTSVRKVDGGNGVDTVNVNALGFVDFRTFNSKFSSLEKIDLGGGASNNIVLDVQTVLNLSESNLPDITTSNTVLVKGDATVDRLTLVGVWTKGAVVNNLTGETGDYTTYTAGAARVLVQADIAVTFAPSSLTVDGTNGFKLTGAAAGDFTGRSVSNAGDVNGDGFDDVIVGAFDADAGAGASYVVFGKATGFADIDLATAPLTGANGFKISGAAAGDFSGFSVSNAGDVNGDGFADLIIGAYGVGQINNAYAGASYVVFGKTGGFAADIKLADFGTNLGTPGFKISGAAAGDFSGFSVSNAGDVNGDGLDDLIIGAYKAGVDAGASYVVFGKSAGLVDINLVTLGSGDGFKISGAVSGDLSGRSVSSLGDINGDGFADLIIGAPRADIGVAPAPVLVDAGAAYVVFGSATIAADLANTNLTTTPLNGTNGFKISGAPSGVFGVDGNQLPIQVGGDFAGFSVSSAGDVNGDGYTDLIIGAYLADVTTAANNKLTNIGASYVVFGKATGFGDGLGNLNLALPLNDATGFKISGVNAGDQSGFSVSSAGDVNGDGLDDLIVGAPMGDILGSSAAPTTVLDSGATYIVFGKTNAVNGVGGFAGNLNLADLDGSNGFKLAGVAANDQSGISVSGAGDVNGDGFADLLVGAPSSPSGDPPTVSGAGAAYVIFGGNFTGAVTHVGTAAGETLTGTDAAETFFAGAGVDTINAGGGNDFINGGLGADSMAGGAGDDTYMVDHLNDSVIEGTDVGIDLVESSVSYSLELLVHVENLTLTGTTAINGVGINGTGNALANIIIGNARGNNIQGGDGNDTIAGGGGVDTLDGGNGIDTLVLRQAATIDLSAGDQYVGLTNATGFENVNASNSAAAVSLTGTTATNLLTGGSGNDTIVGGGGADVLVGGLGNDTLTYQNDVVGTTIHGDAVAAAAGTGSDTLVLNQAATINLSAVDQDTLNANVTVTGFENVNAAGAGVAVSITGSAGANIIIGSGGFADTLIGGAGDDTITYQSVAGTTIHGDAGSAAAGVADSDTLRIVNQTQAVTINLSAADQDGVGNANVTGFENVNATGAGVAVSITGSIGTNIIIGSGNFADTLIGGAGDDTITYQNNVAGVTTIHGDLVAAAAGVADSDTLVLNQAATIDLSITADQDTLNANVIVTGFENVNASAATATVNLIGTTGANVLTGGSANDTIAGGGGADTLIGNGGDDIFNFASAIELAAAVRIDGGLGSDTIQMTAATTTLNDASFALGGVNKTISIETLRLTGASTITLGANALAAGIANVVTGNAATNITSTDIITLNVNAAALTDAQVLTLTGSNAASVTLANGDLSAGTYTGNIAVTATTGTNVITTGGGNDAIVGGGGADALNGGAGVDRLTGGMEADTLTGGVGADIFVFAAGDSVLAIGRADNVGTIIGFDTITDFALGGVDTIDTVGVSAVVADGVTDGAINSTLTIATATVKSHSITSGMVTFDDADIFDVTSVLTLASTENIAAVVQYLQSNDIGDAGSTVAFTASIGGTAHTYLFTQGDAAGTNNLDVLVDMVGITATGVSLTAATGNILII